jgi:hypothetical protein
MSEDSWMESMTAALQDWCRRTTLLVILSALLLYHAARREVRSTEQYQKRDKKLVVWADLRLLRQLQKAASCA